MLISFRCNRQPGLARLRGDQRGVVIFLALIMLVALTLGGLALFRSVDVGVMISGNVALQRNATRSADAGTETAIAWLNSASEAVLNGEGAPNYYYPAAMNDVPGGSQTWSDYLASRNLDTLAEDATGNAVSYMIQRLCVAAGQPYTEVSSGVNVNCVRPPNSSNMGSSKGAGVIALQRTASVYYRITVLSHGGNATHAKSLIQTTVMK